MIPILQKNIEEAFHASEDNKKKLIEILAENIKTLREMDKTDLILQTLIFSVRKNRVKTDLIHQALILLSDSKQE